MLIKKTSVPQTSIFLLNVTKILYGCLQYILCEDILQTTQLCSKLSFFSKLCMSAVLPIYFLKKCPLKADYIH